MFTSTILVLLIAIVIALFALPKSLPSGNGSSHPNFLSSGNILLLTAHPDDECLFFAPTLLALTPEVFFLCLSTGDADGLGETRKEELFLSLDVLGVPKERRWVVDNSELRDNITVSWKPFPIAEAVRPYVVENRITTILTFDHGGVSGHPNHASLPTGIAHLLASWSENSQAKPQLYTLLTVAHPLKYIGPFALLHAKVDTLLFDTVYRILWFKSRITKLAGKEEYLTALLAMCKHRSQLVWFRWLYVLFSRYMWVNEWVEVKVDPVIYL